MMSKETGSGLRASGSGQINGARYTHVGNCHTCSREITKLHSTRLSPEELMHLMNTRDASKRSRVSDSPDDHAHVRGNSDRGLDAEICKGCQRELRRAGLRIL